MRARDLDGPAARALPPLAASPALLPRAGRESPGGGTKMTRLHERHTATRAAASANPLLRSRDIVFLDETAERAPVLAGFARRVGHIPAVSLEELFHVALFELV